MKKELLEIFESAKKAADAAVEDGAEESRCVDALKQLKKVPVTMQLLIETQVGKRLRPLTKHPREKIQAVASDLLDIWKKIVLEENSKNKTNGSSETKTPAKVDINKAETVKVERIQSVKVEKVSHSEAIKVEKSNGSQTLKSETVSRSDTIKVEKYSSGEPVKVEKIPKQEKEDSINKVQTVKSEKVSRSDTLEVDKYSSGEPVKVEKMPKQEKEDSSVNKFQASKGPPKFSSMIKCNDSFRDKTRELLAEAFSRVSKEAEEYILDAVNDCDPIRVAVSVESALFDKLGRSNGPQKHKYRSIIFNIRDQNNPDLRRRVLIGEVKPDRLISMTPEEMASDQRRQENKQIREKTLFDCERGGAQKATTDQFRCGRCGQRKTTYYQLQTRSADEPMTTYVTCVNCNNHWKFC